MSLNHTGAGAGATPPFAQAPTIGPPGQIPRVAREYLGIGGKTERLAAEQHYVALILLWTARVFFAAAFGLMVWGGLSHIWEWPFSAELFFSGLFVGVMGWVLRVFEDVVL